MAFRLRVWGEGACFARPEFRASCISYDILTPLAAREIFEAIHWKPAIRWRINRVWPRKPIRFEPFPSLLKFANARVGMGAMTAILRDVEYVIDAEFEFTEKAGPTDNSGLHADTFRRRASKGHAFRQPFLGMAPFAAKFELLEDDDSIITPAEWADADLDFGWMIHDFAGAGRSDLRYFRAVMRDGVVEIPRAGSPVLAG